MAKKKKVAAETNTDLYLDHQNRKQRRRGKMAHHLRKSSQYHQRVVNRKRRHEPTIDEEWT